MTGASAHTAVITGASAGLGQATAAMFANMGWHVIGVGRDPARCAAAEVAIRAAAPSAARIDFLRGDFTLMSEVRRIADDIKLRTRRLTILINNAGGVRDKLYLTAEGLEATFAANHLAPFLLTRELLPLLEATAAASPPGTVRVLGVSSSGHEASAGMHWDDLNMLDHFTTGGAYCQAKLANILFTRELDRRVAGGGIIAQCMHPGTIDSNFASHGDDMMKAYIGTLEKKSPELAARTLVWMATAPETGCDGGRYFFELQEVAAAAQALDDAAARRLWTESESILARLGY